ncbi:3-methyladenine DNA glycosylase [Actinocorallia sp. A-T 12471]|uniref:3-methyladenine DNA glycosylase n=1 Tax=Actinocorallia sp. A-T 12471 TaxID=3089813 RepID=UPI0029D1BE2D|nr:3-methyladenine DNA glycosylase [Actinocorallia sp. A-T 12471]MDX6739257.1 3-methyladenine DNA glycosylase [Actinocorallia sp. A-T 12471]
MAQVRDALMPAAVWRDRAEAHRARLEGMIGGYLALRRAGRAHPVEDFLFTYYGHRPGRLMAWHPGAGVVLEGAKAAEFGMAYADTPDGATLDLDALLPKRAKALAWTRDLLAATAARPAHLGCFGMHEWAMVYKLGQDEIRHAAWPLRLPPEEVAEVVDRRGVRCSHFDAFRFFTPPARPLNVLQPTREGQREQEQPGCLHANMDLYKWAYKLSPMIPAELVADCFALAREIRAVDMRASPYDMAALGHPPIRVETAEGRAEYAAFQRSFAERAEPLRAALVAHCDRLLALL